MPERHPSPPYLRLISSGETNAVPAVSAEHPSAQLGTANESVFEWHGLVEHETGETPCCHQRIEVTNLVDADHHGVVPDVVAMLSTVLHEWNGYDVMVLVTITPPRLHQE